MDQTVISIIVGVIAALTTGAAVSKFIVNMSIAPLKLQNAEILKTLKEISDTLKDFQINQTKQNGDFVKNSTCERHLTDIYSQVDNVRDRVSKIEGILK